MQYSTQIGGFRSVYLTDFKQWRRDDVGERGTVLYVAKPRVIDFPNPTLIL
jgi:hypothetical protein